MRSAPDKLSQRGRLVLTRAAGRGKFAHVVAARELQVHSIRYKLAAAIGLTSLAAGCSGAEAGRADTACDVAVAKAMPLLPEGVDIDVMEIEPGKSGEAVSCKIVGADQSLMVDATVTCSGGTDALMECTTIDGIQTMLGEVLYP